VTAILASLPMGCGASQASKISGPVLCAVGGLDDRADTLSSLEIYDPASESWSKGK